MAFAIFYNLSDLDGLRDGLTRADIPAADAALALAFWQAGISGYATAPLAPDAYRCVMTPGGQVCDPDCRMLVVDGRHKGQALTLAQLRALLDRLSVALSLPILAALASDMGSVQGGADTWP